MLRAIHTIWASKIIIVGSTNIQQQTLYAHQMNKVTNSLKISF